MALPKQVQRQLDEATAAEAAIQASLTQQSQTLVTDPSQLIAPAANEPVVQASQPPAVPAAPQAPSEDWQQKYKSLQGMFAQKTSELQGQVKVYESQMTNLQRQIDTLMQSRSQEATEKKVSIDPKDIENFGADMIEMVQKYAREIFAAMDGRISALEKAVQGVNTRTEVTLEQQFYASLKGLVPDWEQVNANDAWLGWLAEVDPVYGAPRQAALDAGRQALDVQRVANVFNAFKAAHQPRQQDSLASQVAPTTVASPAPVSQAQVQKPILAAKFVERFYNDVAKGRYVGKEAEMQRVEAEINEAASEGRIR
ncbi:MAG: hypothetical protein HXX17_07905 [Geobacteraceae bacterium]|nr:hypothetical protein [Geobacteraceae bacterium]